MADVRTTEALKIRPIKGAVCRQALLIAPTYIISAAGRVTPGNGSMPNYRLYFLSEFSGHIDRAEDLFAPDDVSAICAVQERDVVAPMELWCGSRKVSRFDAKPLIWQTAPRPGWLTSA
jgi:hypothetical protein